MSKEIFIDENRILKLKNIICYTFNLANLKDGEDINSKMNGFQNYLKNHNLLSFEPLVISTVMIGGDEPKILLKIMSQIKEEYNAIAPYEYIPEFKTEPCLFAHFEGAESDSQIANSKLQVYAYENEIVLDSVSHLVYLNKSEDNFVKLDIFIPII